MSVFWITCSCLVIFVNCVDSETDVIPNTPPNITSLPNAVTILERTNAQIVLYHVNYTDAEGDNVNCSIHSVSPPAGSSAFGLLETDTGFTVHLLNNSGLNSDTVETYDVAIRCWDNFGSTTEILCVVVIPNSAPFFTNLPSSLALDANAALGTVVYRTYVSDNDSEPLTFSMTSLPETPALFNINAGTGEIQTVMDLGQAVNNAYVLSVTVSDGFETSTATLSILLTNVNNLPTITNLPASVTLREDTAVSTNVFTLFADDADDDNVVLTYTVTPSLYNDFFNVSPNINNGNEFNVILTGQLNYERQNSFVVGVYASDGIAMSGPFSLTVIITDVNEPCTFHPQTYHVTMHEGTSGTGNVDPGFDVTDEDTGDTMTLSIVTSPNSSLFGIDPGTGIVRFSTNYDRDVSHPASVVLTVQCMDAFGDTGTATVSVTILDVNDNAPTFEKTGYLFYFNEDINPGGLIALLTAEDDDSGVNNDIVYTWNASSEAGTQYFDLNAGGSIVLKQSSVNLTTGSLFRFVVTATDQGSPPLSGSATVDIIYKVKETTLPAGGTKDEDIRNDMTNIAVAAAIAGLGVILSGMLSYCIFKHCTDREPVCMCIMKRQNAKVSSFKQSKQKPDPRNEDFDVWYKKDEMGCDYMRGKHVKQNDIGGVTFTSPTRISIQ